MKRKTTDEFILEATKVHKGKYNYSNVQYRNSWHKVKIICPIHGEFYQTPHEHLRAECFKCGEQTRIKSKTINTQIFVDRARKIHSNIYNYDNTNFVHNKQKVFIQCSIHGPFSQTPNAHLTGQGCPKCRISNGERRIIQVLEDNKIQYEYEKIFPDCRNPSTNRNLKFDFFIPSIKLLIEYDGEQHFRPTTTKKYSLTLSNVKSTQMRDNLKNNYASKNGLTLLRIPYTEINNISQILSSYVTPKRY